MKVVVFPNKGTDVKKLIREFKDLNFKDMGGLGKYPGSEHYHITSKEKSKTGVVEITFYTVGDSNSIEIKLATNRVGTWGEEGFGQFQDFLSQ